MNAPSIMPTESGRRGYVYAVRDDTASAVKIGFSSDPMRRLAQLQTASAGRLRLIGAAPAVIETEAELHGVFRDRRMSGEWFDDADGAVSAALSGVTTAGIIRLLRASADALLREADALAAEGQMQASA